MSSKTEATAIVMEFFDTFDGNILIAKPLIDLAPPSLYFYNKADAMAALIRSFRQKARLDPMIWSAKYERTVKAKPRNISEAETPDSYNMISFAASEVVDLLTGVLPKEQLAHLAEQLEADDLEMCAFSLQKGSHPKWGIVATEIFWSLQHFCAPRTAVVPDNEFAAAS